MSHLLTALIIVLVTLVIASITTLIMSIDARKGWNKHLVFQDFFFFTTVLLASAMSYKDYFRNPDPVDVMLILAVFYLVVCRVPKWGVLK